MDQKGKQEQPHEDFEEDNEIKFLKSNRDMIINNIVKGFGNNTQSDKKTEMMNKLQSIRERE